MTSKTRRTPKRGRAVEMPRAKGRKGASGGGIRGDLAVLLFLTLICSYGYFWQSRDWNAASRLMLTYSIVDRGEVHIDGLEDQAGMRSNGQMVAGDLAFANGHFYTEKAPGQSFLGALIYIIVKGVAKLDDHPTDIEGMPYYAPDYWCTLLTSGVFTAGISILLYAFAIRMKVGHLPAVLLSLGYGLGTPAFVYATLFYGHQTVAFCTLWSAFLIYRGIQDDRLSPASLILAGILCGYSMVVEYPSVGAVAVISFYLVWNVQQPRPLAQFFTAALLAFGLLLAYNYKSFGSPFELGYGHLLDTSPYKATHSDSNPLGVRLPAWESIKEVSTFVMWGRYRGLLFYAPILILAPLGFAVFFVRRQWGLFFLSVGVFLSVLAVNISYPSWQGGWCTGPRFLIPGIPFLMLPVAALVGSDRTHSISALALMLSLAGAGMMLGAVAVGGRFPHQGFDDPMNQIVLPHLEGEYTESHSSFPHADGRQFEWNVGRWVFERTLPEGMIEPEPSRGQTLQLAPLVLFWLMMFFMIVRTSRLKSDAIVSKVREVGESILTEDSDAENE